MSREARAQLEALEAVELPTIAQRVWLIFVELSMHRGSTGFGPGPLSWLDIDAWHRVTGGMLNALERAWVFELDRIFLEDVSAEMKKRKPSK
jgi:hypothetical protein